jgi:hypothetical protein
MVSDFLLPIHVYYYLRPQKAINNDYIDVWLHEHHTSYNYNPNVLRIDNN